MAISPTHITVTNDALAEELMSAGKKLIELGMSLQNHGFEVELDYTRRD